MVAARAFRGGVLRFVVIIGSVVGGCASPPGTDGGRDVSTTDVSDANTDVTPDTADAATDDRAASDSALDAVDLDEATDVSDGAVGDTQMVDAPLADESIDASTIDTGADVRDATIDSGRDSSASYTLTVTPEGAGAVDVSSVICALSCTRTARAGTRFDLVATPQPGQTFTGWTGACTGTDPNCTISLTGDTVVGATFSQTAGTQWVRWLDGVGNDAVGGLALDPDGSIVMLGEFAGTVDFGGVALTNPSTTANNLVLARLGSDGSVTSAVTFGGQYAEHASGVSVSPDRSITMIGDFATSTNFGSTTLSAVTSAPSAFVARTAADGSVLWAQRFNGNANAVRALPDGDVIVGGSFRSFEGVQPPRVAVGRTDAIVVRYGPDGTVRWATSFGGTDVDDVRGVAVDPSGRVYVVGSVTGPVDLGQGPLYSGTGAGGYFAVLSALTGAVTASRALGDVPGAIPSAVAVDSSGYSYVAGSFTGTVNLYGVGAIPSYGLEDAFVIAIAPDLSRRWVDRFGGNGYDAYSTVNVDDAGNVFLTGASNGTSANFGGGAMVPPASFLQHLASANGTVYPFRRYTNTGPYGVRAAVLLPGGDDAAAGTAIRVANLGAGNYATVDDTLAGFVMRATP